MSNPSVGQHNNLKETTGLFHGATWTLKLMHKYKEKMLLSSLIHYGVDCQEWNINMTKLTAYKWTQNAPLGQRLS